MAERPGPSWGIWHPPWGYQDPSIFDAAAYQRDSAERRRVRARSAPPRTPPPWVPETGTPPDKADLLREIYALLWSEVLERRRNQERLDQERRIAAQAQRNKDADNALRKSTGGLLRREDEHRPSSRRPSAQNYGRDAG